MLETLCQNSLCIGGRGIKATHTVVCIAQYSSILGIRCTSCYEDFWQGQDKLGRALPFIDHTDPIVQRLIEAAWLLGETDPEVALGNSKYGK